MMGQFLATIGTLVALGTGQGQTVFIKTDTQAEIETGRAAYEQMLASGRVSKNENEIRRVQRILDQLQAAFKDRPYPFQAVVLVDNTVNASCYPGGYMVVHQGLLVKMARDEELAFILGHEMGHAVRRHWVRSLRRKQTDAVVDILGIILTDGWYRGTNRRLSDLAYEREQELEADAFGTELYLRAGFSPEIVTKGMEILRDEGAKQKDRTPEYLRTHPLPETRLEYISKTSAALLAGGIKAANPGEPVDVSVRAVFGDLPVLAAAGNVYQPLVPGTIWTYGVSGGKGEAE